MEINKAVLRYLDRVKGKVQDKDTTINDDNLNYVNRLVVVDSLTGRVYDKNNITITTSIQDDLKTLKIYVKRG